MMAKYREIIGGCVFFMFAAAYYVGALSIKQFAGNDMVDSQFIPKLYGIIIMILSALQVLFGIMKMKKDEAEDKEDDDKPHLSVQQQIISFLMSFALLIIYVALLDSVGFIIMSTLFIIFMTTLLLPKEKRNSKRVGMTAVIAAAFSVAVYMVFVEGFALTLPAGILG